MCRGIINHMDAAVATLRMQRSQFYAMEIIYGIVIIQAITRFTRKPIILNSFTSREITFLCSTSVRHTQTRNISVCFSFGPSLGFLQCSSICNVICRTCIGNCWRAPHTHTRARHITNLCSCKWPEMQCYCHYTSP